MFLVDTVHSEIGETCFSVIVESRLLHLIHEFGVEGGKTAGKVTHTESIAEFSAEDVFGSEVVYKIVLHARGHKTVACQWCAAFISS